MVHRILPKNSFFKYQKRSKQIRWWPAGWWLVQKRRFATGDDVMMFIMWPGLPRRRSVGTCDGVVTAPAGHSGAQWAADNNNLLWRLHSKYNMYLIIHSITFCFYTVILSSSMSVFSSNDWDIHIQLLRFIHFDAFMPFLTSIKRAFSVLDLTSHIHLNLIW